MEWLLFAIIILFCLCVVFQPQVGMMAMYLIDKEIRAVYNTAWKQDKLATEARAYHQHIVNHGYMNFSFLYMTLASSLFKDWLGLVLFITGCLGWLLTVLLPVLIEVYIDPIVRNKGPVRWIDLRERMIGIVFNFPLFIVAIYSKFWM